MSTPPDQARELRAALRHYVRSNIEDLRVRRYWRPDLAGDEGERRILARIRVLRAAHAESIRGGR